MKSESDLEDLDFSDSFVSARSKGLFPDLAIKINVDDDIFTGGELVDFKGSQTFTIASFNSTIPTGQKAICDIIDESKMIKEQMEKAGNNIDSVPIRDVYYLISGKKNNDMKIILVHGVFFETIPVRDLIRKSFEEIVKEAKTDMTNDEISKLSVLFSKQKLFSKTRHIDQASVKIRFRIMTEAETDANLLNSKLYPEIKTNTINLCIPYKSQKELNEIIYKFDHVFEAKFAKITLVHKVNNAKFILFQKRLENLNLD